MSQKYYYVEFHGSLTAADKRHTFKSLIESDHEFLELATKNSGVDYYLPASAPTRAPIGAGEYKVHNAIPTCNTADPTSVAVMYEARDMTEDEINVELKKRLAAQYDQKVNDGITLPTTGASSGNRKFALDDEFVKKINDLLGLIASGATIDGDHRFLIATCNTKCTMTATKLKSISRDILKRSFELKQTRDKHLLQIEIKTKAVKDAAAGNAKQAAMTSLKEYKNTISTDWPS